MSSLFTLDTLQLPHHILVQTISLIKPITLICNIAKWWGDIGYPAVQTATCDITKDKQHLLKSFSHFDGI